jgi:hypothetical protein
MPPPPPGPPPRTPGPLPGEPPPLPALGAPPRRRPLLILSVVVVAVLVLVVGGLIGAEFYARHSAKQKITDATLCETKDSADTVSVSFSNTPPVLWQYLTDQYPKITVTTGTHIRSAQGMTIDVAVADINMNGDATKKGTIGSINATMKWTTQGILQTVKEAINDYLPDSLKSLGLDSLVQSVTTNPSAGTVTVHGGFGFSITVQPKVENGGLRLVIPDNGIQTLIGSIPKDSVQSMLDDKTKSITDNSLNIKVVEPIEITSDAVTLHFSANNSAIPLQSTDPCFANL